MTISSSASRSRLAVIFVAIVTAFMGARALFFVHRFSVNLLWWDQWDFWEPLLYQQGWWKAFDREHGPIREGIGLVFAKIVANLSHWNTNADAYSIVCLVILASVAAVLLKYRLFKKITWWDAIIPVIVLTIAQFEIWVATPNAAHGPFPILLLMLYCLGWTVDSPARRHLCLIITSFFLIYTGFSIVIAPVHVYLVAAEMYTAYKTRDKRRVAWSVATLLSTAGTVALFMIGYVTVPGCYGISHPKALDYVRFVALMLVHFIGPARLTPAALTIGILIALVSTAIVVPNALRRWKPEGSTDSQGVVLVILLAYTLIFAINAAIGRLCLGIEASMASRYILYLVPLFLGLYFRILHVEKSWFRNALLVGFVICMCANSIGISKRTRATVHWFHDGKAAWRACYLQHEDIALCNQQTQFSVYPLPEATHLGKKLDFLKRNKLNLYATQER
jgi:hypothetical protein